MELPGADNSGNHLDYPGNNRCCGGAGDAVPGRAPFIGPVAESEATALYRALWDGEVTLEYADIDLWQTFFNALTWQEYLDLPARTIQKVKAYHATLAEVHKAKQDINKSG